MSTPISEQDQLLLKVLEVPENIEGHATNTAAWTRSGSVD